MTGTHERTAIVGGLDTAAHIRPHDLSARGLEIRYVANLYLTLPATLRVAELRADGVLIWSAADRLDPEGRSRVKAADARPR